LDPKVYEFCKSTPVGQQEELRIVVDLQFEPDPISYGLMGLHYSQFDPSQDGVMIGVQ
ncbi:Hypothetical predicted protein, partial [Olea europaea subsp. europaea]